MSPMNSKGELWSSSCAHTEWVSRRASRQHRAAEGRRSVRFMGECIFLVRNHAISLLKSTVFFENCFSPKGAPPVVEEGLVGVEATRRGI